MDSLLLLIAQSGFVALTLIYFGFLLRLIGQGIERTSWERPVKKKFLRRIITWLALWIIFLSIWSLWGVMSDFSIFPFNFLPVIVIPLITILILTFSGKFNQVLRQIDFGDIIKLQSFRFFVELLLWLLFIGHLLPRNMTFEGRNFDVLTGVTAPLIVFLMSRKKISRRGLVFWNIAGLGLLINIVTIAILSTPSPIRVFMEEPANTVVMYFPVCLLPGMLVPLAYGLHFFSLRQIAIERRTGN